MLGMGDADGDLADSVVMSFRECSPDAASCVSRWSREVDHDFAGAHAFGDARRAVDDQMQPRFYKQSVLVRERLAFGGIDDDNRWATLVGEAPYGPPLAVGGEPRSASAPESAALDDIDEPCPADGPSPKPRTVVGESLRS